MKYLSEDIIKKLLSAINQKYENVLVTEIDRFIDFFNSVAEFREAFPDYDESMMIVNLEKSRKICSGINKLVDTHYQKNADLSFDSRFPDLVDELDEIILQLEPELRVEQSEDRFKPLADDKKVVRFAKVIKNIFLKAEQLLLKFLNLFLIKLKRKPFRIKYWNHRIPLRSVGFYFLRNKVLEELISLYEIFSRKLCKNTIAYWNADKRYDEDFISNFMQRGSTDLIKRSLHNPEKITNQFELLKRELQYQTESSIKRCISDFSFACDRTGTVEIRKSKFKEKNLEKNFNFIKKEFDNILQEWDTTLYVLGENWELNCDFNLARYSALEVFFKFEKSLSVKNKIQIIPQFKEISGALKFIIEKLGEHVTGLQSLERVITFSKETLHKILLSSTLPNLINSISDLNLAKIIDEAILDIKNQINSIKEVRAFVKTVNYDERIKASEIDDIYPREFVSFKAVPKFSSSLEEIKEKYSIELQSIQSELINLGNMSDFGLESAITAAATENIPENEIREIAVDAIEVSVNRKDRLKESFERICENVIRDLRDSIANYSKEISGYSLNSKILEIRTQLAKAKSRIESKGARDRFFSAFKNSTPGAIKGTKINFKKRTRFFSDKGKQSSLKENKDAIKSEISDFLSKVNGSVEKLPYIYRRLYQITPLENERLYISRKVEEAQLEKAYNSWLNGGYASVIISAEKGSGVTSLINIFQKKLESKNTVCRLSIMPTIYNSELLLKIFSKALRSEVLMNYNELIEFLNKKENNQVIVVENLQHLYLRSVKGFVGLKILTEVISKTSKNIFWITSSTLYASEFLNEAIRLNDIFGHHIFLKHLQSNKIIEVIKKRNSISGYNIVYEPGRQAPEDKDFENLTYEQQQSLLERKFFNSLNKFAQSNISLALLFWLNSISKMDERKVVINADFQISDSILDSLSAEKIFVLKALVLHDGLGVNDLSKAINYSLSETNQLMQILFDEGVLVKNDGVFFINPLLFRHSVKLLKSKNLL